MKFNIEEVEVYSNKMTAPPNEFQDALSRLAEMKNEKASICFENTDFKSFKYAASKLRSAKKLVFLFRKDKEKKDTHTRVWWTNKEITSKKEKEEIVNTTLESNFK